jgi:malate dehydrogenase (oxaloacetate-decarboxylating)(NADP+)
MLSALGMTGGNLKDQKYLYLGAGEAGIGIGDLVVNAMLKAGMSKDDAKQRNWFFDSKGLVVKSRADLVEHKRPYAHDHDFLTDFLTAIETLKPTGIIGVSGQGQTFTKPIIEAMARLNERPLIFALSNPTSKSECTAQQAYEWSDGRAIFASGSPFAPVTYNGQIFVPGQANNAYVFPGVGLGLVASGATRVPDAMFAAAAVTLAEMAEASDLAQGRIYPALERIREVSARIAVAVAEVAYAEGLATLPRPDDLPGYVQSLMYQPSYE